MGENQASERVLVIATDFEGKLVVTSVGLVWSWKEAVSAGKLIDGDAQGKTVVDSGRDVLAKMHTQTCQILGEQVPQEPEKERLQIPEIDKRAEIAGVVFGANTPAVETQPVQAVAVPETPKPESEAQKLQRRMIESPAEAFAQIKQKVEAFPESNLKGVIARKEGLRVATLDEKGALAEMRVLGHAIVFRLSGLDREKLKICLKSGFLSTGDLLSCFKADTANPDNLIIRAYLDLGRLKIFGDMQRYDVGKGKLASSLPYLDLNPEELAVLKKVMGDSLTLVTLLTKLSHPPEKEISGDLHDDPNFYRRHQRRNYLSLSSGNSFPSDEPRVSPVEQKLNKVRSELEIKDSATGSAPVRRDTPDNKKKYWAQKGKKNTPKKHK